MPKIAAGSVAEHRATQYNAVLDVAERLVVEEHGKVPTLTRVAQEMGLSRSTMYGYVSSSTELLIQLLLRIIPEWSERISREIDRAGKDPRARLAVYVDSTFTLFVDGNHGPLMAAVQVVPEVFSDPRVVEAHDHLVATLQTALSDVGGELDANVVPLIDAAVQKGTERVTSGEADRDRTLQALHRMARAMVENETGSDPAG